MLPFQVTQDDIECLNPHQFADVLNKLLRAEAALRSVPQAQVLTSDRIFDRDLGGDALVENVPAGAGEWIPEGSSLWQFKSGKVEKRHIETEFRKEGVIEAITGGATYCLMLGRGYGSIALKNRRTLVSELFEKLGLEPRCSILSPAHIALWASSHPAIAQLPYFNKPFGGLWLLEELEMERVHEIPYVPDESREEILRSLQHNLRQPLNLPAFRIEAHPGVGKTRLLIETLRHEEFRWRVLYASLPDDIPNDFFPYIARNQDVHIILVVEGCSEDHHRRLQDKVGRCHGRLALITLGPLTAITESGEGQFEHRLNPLSDKAIETIILETSPSIPREKVSTLARIADGYPRLAVIIARNIALRPELTSAGDLLRASEMRIELTRLIGLDSEEQHALQAVSILTRVGWEDVLKVEGQVIAELFSIPWRTLQFRVQNLYHKGLIVRQGRYRNVTPYPLAVSLAHDAWDGLGEDIISLIESLPSLESQEALFERIADLGPHESAMMTIERFLEESPRFESIQALELDNNASLLRFSSRVAPRAATRTLQRIIEPLSIKELQPHTFKRNELVWTLRELVWWKETFFEAGKLLLRLAEAEGRPFNGVSAEAWRTLFQVYLGGTEVPIEKRYCLIEETLPSTSVEQRLLTVQAIKSALATHVSRSGGSERQGGRIIPKEWYPETKEEMRNAWEDALALLDKSIRDPIKEVANEAIKVFLSSSYPLVFAGLREEIIDRIVSMETSDDNHQREMRNAIQMILRDEKIQLSEHLCNQLQRKWEELSEKDFHTRLRRWIGQLSFQDMHDNLKSEHTLTEKEITALAKEAIQEPSLLAEELDWLASDHAQQAFAFGRKLGRLDDSKDWFDDIVSRARAGVGYALLSGYLLGRADAGEAVWREEVLDKWAEDEEELAEAIFTATHAGPSSDRGAKRLTTLVDNGWIQPMRLGHLIYERWPEDISFEAFVEIFRRLTVDESLEGTERSLELLRSRLGKHKEEKEALEDIAWELLERPVPLGYGQQSVVHAWAAVAEKYVENNPLRIIRVILESLERDEYPMLDERHSIGQIFQEATKMSPEKTWKLVGDHLLRESRGAWRLQLQLKDWYEGIFEADYLLEWAEANQPLGPEILADLVPLGEEELNLIARGLLLENDPESRVAVILAVKPFGGAWSGRRSAKLEGWLERVNRWANDPEHNVRVWAEKLRNNLREDIQSEREREAEDRW